MTVTAEALDAGEPLRGSLPREAPAVRETVYRPPHPLDLTATVGVLRRGPRDPTMAIDGPVIWRASRTPDGVALLALRMVSGEVRASAWGPGAEHAIALVPRLCGADDDPSSFDPSPHPLLAEAARRAPGLRLTRTDAVFEALAGAVLEQKVTGLQAFGAWRSLVSRFGEAAPGPAPRPLHAPPPAETWRRIPSWAWHRAGVEPPQSRTIVRAAERGDRIERAVHAATDGPARDAVLTGLPGVGAWTAAETRARALGDPDAVSVGDYHLAHEIGFALTGRRTDDAGMLQLLAPWAGHRQRVIRLIRGSGVAEPRRGPRLAPEDHRRR
ncbi:3-methyladenine DNA glycosylase/8-oxoguanine DNA glycosylase [Microbacterium resistens]|uniref:3-methyladenine DNA glycosylase/8-oxoguanine DNA glycosylase n=1 Tax=Microbacterium resistens TaxID=156977 RepID=A0ABU1SAM1_9MICO|nr:DNA-3-methyladenine glycosylase 2 family protein [Microbacterium resistens]MDR6866653.1 3-methyladenine DNA glycosylase/8-oxoguanine DNA glycosylase [Microbacterium resistens]